MSSFAADRLGVIASGYDHRILAILGYNRVIYSPQANHNQDPRLTSNLHPLLIHQPPRAPLQHASQHCCPLTVALG